MGCVQQCVEQLNGKEVQGKVLRVERYRERDQHSNTIYVRGLAKMSEVEATECIHGLLSECGEIKEIRLTKEQFGNGHKLKGFGYVEFVNADSVQKALECKERKWNGKRIEFREYKSTNERKSGDGGGGNEKEKNVKSLTTNK